MAETVEEARVAENSRTRWVLQTLVSNIVKQCNTRVTNPRR